MKRIWILLCCAAHPGYAPVMGTMTAMDMRKIEKTPFGQDEYLEEGSVR